MIRALVAALVAVLIGVAPVAAAGNGELTARVSALESQNIELQAQVADLQSRVAKLEGTTPTPTPSPTPRPTVSPSPTVSPTLAPTPRPTVTPAPTASPTASPTAATGCTDYLAPTGNDANPGTISAPRRTLLAGSRLLAPGDTLCLRGGTYADPGGYNWSASGTSAAPVTVRPYPGEVPVFDGRLTVQQALIVNGQSHVVFDGLAFTRYRPRDNGVVLIVGGAHHVTLRGIRSFGHDTAGSTDHHLYPSGASDVLIEGCELDRVTGVGIHAYGNGGADRLTIRGCTIVGPSTGILLGSGSDGFLIEGNAISQTSVGLHFPSHGATGRVTGNLIDAPAGLWVESLSASPIAEDHDCIHGDRPFRVGWPGAAWTLTQWQATGRGEGTTTTCH